MLARQCFYNLPKNQLKTSLNLPDIFGTYTPHPHTHTHTHTGSYGPWYTNLHWLSMVTLDRQRPVTPTTP